MQEGKTGSLFLHTRREAVRLIASLPNLFVVRTVDAHDAVGGVLFLGSSRPASSHKPLTTPSRRKREF